MYRNEVSSIAAAFALLASLFAIAPTAAQAQSKPAKAPKETWNSYISTDAPDQLYRQHCAVCHGVKGDGESLAKYALDPQPRNFTSKESRKELTRAHMIETLNKGAVTDKGERTAMISWKEHLSREQMEALVDYVIVNFMDGQVAKTEHVHAGSKKHKGHNHSAANVKPVDYPYGLQPNADNGKSVYAANCSKCHGDNGDGQGAAALKAKIKPRNFHDDDFSEFANGFTLFSAITKGRGHMPSWEKALNKQEIADVSEYVLKTYVKKADEHEHEHEHEHHEHHHH